MVTENQGLAIEERKTADGKRETLYIRGSGLFSTL
jgi:hypothetical protein